MKDRCIFKVVFAFGCVFAFEFFPELMQIFDVERVDQDSRSDSPQILVAKGEATALVFFCFPKPNALRRSASVQGNDDEAHLTGNTTPKQSCCVIDIYLTGNRYVQSVKMAF